MRSAAPALVAVVLLPVGGFFVGRHGGPEPARSEAAAPAAFQPASKSPRIAALRPAPAPPALAREKAKKKTAPGSGGATAFSPSVAAPPVTNQAPVQPQSQPQVQSPSTNPQPSSPGTSSPPDLGTRDE